MATHLPNIVWLFLDQCRADVLGCYGHPFVQTPNIDRLAANGVLFENAFCQSPICVPSRASILSGRYAHQTGVYDNAGVMRPDDSHLLTMLGQAGFHMANVGKVHLGITAAAAGFHVQHEIAHDGIPHFHVPDDYPADWPWRTFDAPGFPQPVIYATDLCARERSYSAVGVSTAIDLFASHPFDERPLFLRLSLDRPHTPVSSPQPYDTLYAEQTRLPEYSLLERAGQIETLRNYIQQRRWDRFSDDEILKQRSYYYGLVTHLDYELGRLLDAIEASEQRDRTLIILAADHGCMLGEHGLYVKGMHYHTETARVPLLLSWPAQLPTNRRVAGLVELVDLLPTVADLCGLPTPPPAMGRSLRPLIDGADTGRDAVFAEQFAPANPHRWVAVRTPTHLYTYYPNSNEATLFDLAADPSERINLMQRQPPRPLVANLRARLAEFLK